MNFLLALALWAGLEISKPHAVKHQEYHGGDFYVYNDAKGRDEGLPFLNKIYIDSRKQHKKFGELVIRMSGVKDIKEADGGLVIHFDSKANALAGLNKALEVFPTTTFPVVRYSGLEVLAVNELLVTLNPGTNIDDYVRRLNKQVDAEISATKAKTRDPNCYVLNVEKLRNPSNILLLANMVANDKFWVKGSIPHFLPLGGPIDPKLVVTTPSVTHLGETRALNIHIDVMDPNLVIRTDLLPQTFNPFPNLVDPWIEFYPMQVVDKTVNGVRTVDIKYEFRCVRYGSFTFPPVTISYEWGDELRTKATNFCNFEISSITNNSTITDIQPLTNNGLHVPLRRVDKVEVKPNPVRQAFQAIKVFGTGVFGLLGLFLVSVGLIDLLKCIKFTSAGEVDLWKELRNNVATLTISENAEKIRAEYLKIQAVLQKVMLKEFGVSLYTLDISQCNDDFKRLYRELNKIYMENPEFNKYELSAMLWEFTGTKKYA